MDTPRRWSDDDGRSEDGLAESQAWNITAYMMSGLLGFGLPAWLLDRWLGTGWITPVGLLAGMAAAFVIIWFRYGTDRS